MIGNPRQTRFRTGVRCGRNSEQRHRHTTVDRTDEMVPVALAERIYAAAGEPKQFWKVEGAGHRGLRAKGGGAYAQKVVDFYREYLPL